MNYCKLGKLILGIFLLFSVSACGFKLRGMLDVPPWLHHVAFIFEDTNADLLPAFSAQFRGYGLSISDNPSQAAYWLILVKTIYTQQIISVASGTNPRQYQLTYRVQYLLRTPPGKIIKAPAEVEVTRLLTVNNDRILGSDEEANTMRAEMRRDVVIQILNRLNK
jgi:LPS-assembly lipoprotein